ncbi:MAG: helix-turn-helix domain-containing protein [Mycobacterium sp.]
MSTDTVEPSDAKNVRSRLIEAADAEMAERGSTEVQMTAIAERAGVSRATAFRRLGSVAETVTQVALRRSRHHVAQVQALMEREAGAFTKLEAALIYTARELPTDPTIAALIAQHSASIQDPDVHGVSASVMGPVVLAGQSSGEIRSDLGLDEILDFLVEQTYLAAEDPERSEERVRRRLRHFIIPALEVRASAGVPSGELVSRVSDVREAATVTATALAKLMKQLDRATEP